MMYSCHGPEETTALGRWLGERLRPGSLVLLQGTLGAGKTVFTKGIAEALSISSTITSPTFPIIQEYSGRLGLNHIDLYRVDTSEDFEQLGILELLDSEAISVIEWSDKMRDQLPEEAIQVNISIDPDGTRRISIEGIER